MHEAPSHIILPPLKEHTLKESQREAEPLLYKFPLPLIKGKGISPSQVKDKGDRVT